MLPSAYLVVAAMIGFSAVSLWDSISVAHRDCPMVPLVRSTAIVFRGAASLAPVNDRSGVSIHELSLLVSILYLIDNYCIMHVRVPFRLPPPRRVFHFRRTVPSCGSKATHFRSSGRGRIIVVSPWNSLKSHMSSFESFERALLL